MKLTKIMLSAIVAGSFMWVGSQASAQPLTLVKLNIKGTALVNTNSSYSKGKNEVYTPSKLKYNNKELMMLLNESPAFKDYLNYQTGGAYSQIPSGAYLAADVANEDVYLMAKNGDQLVRMWGTPRGGGTVVFVDIAQGSVQSTKFSQNMNTEAGSESIQLARFMLSFDDNNGNYMQAHGLATWNSKAAKDVSGDQKVKQNLKYTGYGAVEVINYSYTGTTTAKANGSGKDTIATGFWPF